MIGNPSICALRVGDWAWVAALLEQWLPVEMTGMNKFENFVDRAILLALRGEDPAADLATSARLLVEVAGTDPQFEAYQRWAEAWAAFSAGRFAEARTAGERACDQQKFFNALAGPLLVRTALWEGDAPGAAAYLAQVEGSGFRGAALSADIVAGRAGIDALEGRHAPAVAGFREALRLYRGLGLAFDEAAAAVDMATLLPPSELASPDLQAAIAAARATLERLGAAPFLGRLDGAQAPKPAPLSAAAS